MKSNPAVLKEQPLAAVQSGFRLLQSTLIAFLRRNGGYSSDVLLYLAPGYKQRIG